MKNFNNAYNEIANFFAANPNAGTFQLTNYGNDRITQMVKINQASNEILSALKQDPCSIITLYASFAVHSSKTELSEYALLKELQQYAKTMKQTTQINFDPISIFSINNSIRQKNETSITESRDIRNLIDHHKYDLDLQANPCTIHFKSQEDQNWNFNYDRKFTGQEFLEYLSLLDLFYKCVVNILFCYQLLAVLRVHFVN